MCKYCEEVAKDIEDCVDYSLNANGCHISYDRYEKNFDLWAENDAISMAITHCPWCGRKLVEPKEHEAEPYAQLEADISELKEDMYNQLGKLDRRIINLCRNLELKVATLPKRRWDQCEGDSAIDLY